MPPETLVNYGYGNVFLTIQMILMAAVQPCASGLLCEQEHNQECVQPESASFRFFQLCTDISNAQRVLFQLTECTSNIWFETVTLFGIHIWNI